MRLFCVSFLPLRFLFCQKSCLSFFFPVLFVCGCPHQQPLFQLLSEPRPVGCLVRISREFVAWLLLVFCWLLKICADFHSAQFMSPLARSPNTVFIVPSWLVILGSWVEQFEKQTCDAYLSMWVCPWKPYADFQACCCRHLWGWCQLTVYLRPNKSEPCVFYDFLYACFYYDFDELAFNHSILCR